MTTGTAQCIVDLIVIRGRLWEMRYNENHDEKWRFTFGSSGGSSGKTSAGKKGLTKKSSRVRMGYKETKLVTSEINTYYHSRYEGKRICRYYSGKYSKVYKFENNGYGNYRFIRVTKIK